MKLSNIEKRYEKLIRGSARVPRAVFGVSPKTSSKIHRLARLFVSGGTPETTLETRALPRTFTTISHS